MSNKLQKPLVSIIILNYNAGKLIQDCVKSVLEINYQQLEVIIVDNLSTDNSHKECKEKFPSIKVIENNGNLGYCEGNNVGIRECKGEFVIILNPDTIVESNLIEIMLNTYNKFGEGLYQPKILSISDKKILQSTGNMIHLFGFGFARDKGETDHKQYSEVVQVGYASGTCLFTSKEILIKLKMFDKFLFLYHDDLDLGWRAAQRGIKSYFVPNTAIYHFESYSLKWSQKKFYWLERNRRYCLKTHYSKSTYKKIHFKLILVEFLVWIFYISKGYFMGKLKAEINLWKNRDHLKKKFEEIEFEKTVSDEELIKTFPDVIMVPKDVSGGIMSKLFIKILKNLSIKAKKGIL